MAMPASRFLAGLGRRGLRRAAVVVLGACVGGVVYAGPAYAAPLVVNTCGDPGPSNTVSLRQAVVAATDSGGGTITFDASLSCPPSAPIRLASALPVITNSVVIDNDSGSRAIAVDGRVTVRDFAVGPGGSLTLKSVTVQNGKGATGYGGGIANDGGEVTIVGSTLVGNSAAMGGAIANFNSGTVTVTNSTLTSNYAVDGAGILNAGTAMFNNSTLSGNSATFGGGVSNLVGSLTVRNSIVANSVGGGNCSGQITVSGTYDLTWPRTDLSCPMPSGDPRLLPLADNGGPTQTMALGHGSAAIDRIPVAQCTTTSGQMVATDQRGVSRPQEAKGAQGAACDIGAFEVVTDAHLSIAKSGPATVAPAGSLSYAVTVSNGPGPASVAATDPTWSDTVPAGTTFVSLTAAAAGAGAAAGWACTTPAVGAAGNVRCSDSAGLAAGASARFTLVVRAGAGLAPGSTVTNTATVTAGNASPASSSASTSARVACDHVISGSAAPLELEGGGSWCVSGSIQGHVAAGTGVALFLRDATVAGGVSASDPAAVSVCGSDVNGSVAVSGASGFVLLGDPGDDGCAANTITGSVSLSDNGAGVEVGHNHVSGSLSLSGNAGGGPFPEDAAPELEANTIGGSLACSGDHPAATDDGQPNAVDGTRFGECAGRGF